MTNTGWSIVLVGGAAAAYLLYKSQTPATKPAVFIQQAQAPSSQQLIAAAEANAINTGVGALAQIVNSQTAISGIDNSADYGD